jgi:anti-sigma B factor antagonist
MLQIFTHTVEGVLVISCERGSQVGEGARPSECEALYQAIQARDDARFAVDLAEVDFLGSSDVNFLIMLKRRVDERRGRLVLYQVHSMVQDILRTMRLSRYFVIADDLQQALSLLPPEPGR